MNHGKIKNGASRGEGEGEGVLNLVEWYNQSEEQIEKELRKVKCNAGLNNA